MEHTFGAACKNSSSRPIPLRCFLLCFLLNYFIVLHFIFKSIIEFMFASVVKRGTRFIIFGYGYRRISALILKR